MKKTTVLAATLACAVAAGCGGKTKDKGTGMGSASGMGSDMGSGMGSGSAMGSDMMGAGSASAVETKPAPPPPPPAKTAEEKAARYQECWGFFNDGKWDDMKSCYTADAISEQPGSAMPPAQGVDAIVAQEKAEKDAFPDLKGDLQLVIVNGKYAVGVALLQGTNTGAMKTPMGEMPATKKKVGLAMGHVIEFNDQAQATHEWSFEDTATMMAQLGKSKMPARKAMTKGWAKTTEVVVAKDDDAEKANVAVFQSAVDAFNKHDPKAFGDTLAKNVVWSDQAEAKDLDQKGAVADSKNFWKGFSDVKITPDQIFGAGSYAVMIGNIAGTNDGDVPAMKLKKTGKSFSSPFLHIVKVENGKITGSWIFYDGMGMASQLGMLPAPAAGKAEGKGEGNGADKDADGDKDAGKGKGKAKGKTK